MSRISTLPAHVVALIAAGEIAERPSGIIKELIENSLDAQATHIEITLENGGLDKIVVADNGIGIPHEELPFAVLPHTTSKIKTAQDLEQIASYGFRGEALASIDKVSTMTLISRHQSQSIPYTYQRGELDAQPSRHGMAIGTVVEIKDLFATIPARRKFIAKPASELRQVITTVTKIALANPAVSFTVHHNQKKTLHFPAQQTLTDRFLQATHWDLAPDLIPLTFANPVISLDGIITSPQVARSQPQSQWIFINKRPVHHPPLARTIKLAYGASLPTERHPLFALNLTLSPSVFDINRHPKKETVAFMDEQLVLKTIQSALESTLAQQLPTPNSSYTSSLQEKLTLRDSARPQTDSLPDSYNTATNSEYSPDANTLTQSQQSKSDLEHKSHTVDQKGTAQYRGHFPAQDGISATLKSLINPWKKTDHVKQSEPILQLANTYLVTLHKGELLLIDQHAAHERILFESFRTVYMEEQAGEPQELSPRITTSLTPEQVSILQDHHTTLEKIGFKTHFLGETTVAITAIPKLIPIEQTKQIFTDVLADLLEGEPISLVDTVAHRTLAYLACRSAVMAGDPLDQAERAKLIQELFVTPNFQTCPHGRPTYITYNQVDLEKLFKRR